MGIKRTLYAFVCAALCAGAILGCARGASTQTDAEPYSALRLHILANSDGENDQAVKLAVRDAVLEAAKKRFEAEDIATADEARELLMGMGAELTRAAESTLKKYGMDYGVQLEYGRFAFPERVYGDKTYPAGQYNALRIILGDGAGHNWWCVMFPPLCIIEEPDSPAERGIDGTLEFKSFFAELFERIFGL